MKTIVHTPLPFCLGDGSEENPYRSIDGCAGIAEAMQAAGERGCNVYLPSARYDHTSPIVLRTPSTGLRGEIWACNTDPNGVFEPKNGTKLRRIGTGYPSILVGDDRTLSGNDVSHLGIQGDIVGMDTRSRFSVENPTADCGLAFTRTRVDQAHFTRLSFCGLGAAIVVAENAELDACDFCDVNLDGCGVGVYFAPAASYYTYFRRCVVADTPFYGFYAAPAPKRAHNLEIRECFFVRNGGALDIGDDTAAAVSLREVHNSMLRDNLFDDPGLFWYYDDHATENRSRQPSRIPLRALYLEGNGNFIEGNQFKHCKSGAAYIRGDRNILHSTVTSGDILIEGRGNTVSSLFFTTSDARLVLRGEAAKTTEVIGVNAERIVYEN